MAKKRRKAPPLKAEVTEAIRVALALMKAEAGRCVYTDDIGDIIANLLAKGETLNAICSLEGMPNESAVRSWALDLEHPFAPKYARARLIGYHTMADRIVDIADTDPDPQRSRVRIDSRKWLLSKALPKIYGDKVALTDGDGGKVIFQVVSGVPREGEDG